MTLVAGVDIGGTKVLAALVDDGGVIRHRIDRETDPEAGTSSILSALADLLADRPASAGAIGVAAAGFVEHPSGRIVFAPNLTYDDPDVAARVRSRFGLPAVVENDANAAAWGEREFGAARGAANMVMVTVGTGIGGGIVVDGRLYRGSRGFAAEFGHMTVVDEGPRCACGEQGCLEALASGSAIARMAREAIASAPDSVVLELALDDPRRITGALVTEAARAGDEFALRILGRAGRALGIGLANLANLFDPEVIVVGGGGGDAGRLLLDPARVEMERRIGARHEPPEIRTARLGNDAGVIGVASLARAAERR